MDRFTPAADASERTLTPFRPCLANMGVAAASIRERESVRTRIYLLVQTFV